VLVFPFPSLFNIGTWRQLCPSVTPQCVLPLAALWNVLYLPRLDESNPTWRKDFSISLGLRHNVPGHRPPWNMPASTIQCHVIVLPVYSIYQGSPWYSVRPRISATACVSLERGPSMGSVHSTFHGPPVDNAFHWVNGCGISVYLHLPGSPCITNSIQFHFHHMSRSTTYISYPHLSTDSVDVSAHALGDFYLPIINLNSLMNHGTRQRSTTQPPARREEQLSSDEADDSEAAGEPSGEVRSVLTPRAHSRRSVPVDSH